MQCGKAGVRQADTDVFRCVLNADRQRRSISDGAIEFDQAGFRGAAHGRRLQHDPGRAGLGGGGHSGALPGDVVLGDGDRQRHPPGDLFGHPFHQSAAFQRRQLVGLGCQAADGDTVTAGVDTAVDLAPRRRPVKPAVFVEEGVKHGIDAANVFELAHDKSPVRARLS